MRLVTTEILTRQPWHWPARNNCRCCNEYIYGAALHDKIAQHNNTNTTANKLPLAPSLLSSTNTKEVSRFVRTYTTLRYHLVISFPIALFQNKNIQIDRCERRY
jgi:hypothetical protein